MSTIPIHFLNMIIHSYTSGIAGFAANKEKDVSKKNKSFEVTYLGFFIMILFYSVHSYYFLYGNKLFLTLFENINLFRLADIKESLIWFVLCVFIQILFDTSLLFYLSRKKNINRINSYQENKLFIMIIVICEEISYRLFILDAGVRIFENIPIACCISAVLYVLNHLSIIFKTKIKLYWFASRLLLGLLLSLIALKGGLLFSILLHYLYNFFINHVIPGYSEKITEKR